MRFGELVDAIEFATESMIARRLQELVDEELVAPYERDGQKYYTLTSRGKTLIPILESLIEVGSALER